MLKNYVIVVWRNLKKNRFFSLINIVGLAIGMAACIVILLFVFYEKSFDNFHSKNIYRLNEVQKFEGMVAPQKVALSMFPMGPTLKSELPGIKNFTRINDFKRVTLSHAGKNIIINQILWADSTFLQIFDFKLLEGNRATVLEKPGSAVLTKETARKIFGDQNALGKTLMFYGNDTLTFFVTGILENVPKNSHLQFDGLFAMNTVTGPGDMENWGSNWVNTYLEIDRNADIAVLEKKFPAYLQRHMSDENWKNYELFLQPLREVHASSVNITHDYLNFQKFDENYTYVFSIIAAIVLLIACINFMNLSTAKSAGRAREVGIRKSIGAERWQLAAQFIGESVLLCFFAMVLAVVLVKLFIPYVSNLSQRDLSLPLFSQPSIVLLLIGSVALVGALSGLYPATYLSGFQPTKVLKGNPGAGKEKGRFRNVLVVAQFTGAIVLIIATAFAVKQLRFMRNQDPGFDKEQVLVIPLNSKTFARYADLKQQFLSNSNIRFVSASQQRLGNNLHQAGVNFKGDGPLRDLTSSQVIVDPDYLKLYEIPLVAGRNFSGDPQENGRTYIVNEALAKELLKDNPKASYDWLIGKRFHFGWADSTGTIVGVAKDFNFNSLHHKIETLCIFNMKDWGYSEMSVKINGQQADKAISHLQQVWGSMLPQHPLEYSFLDEHFAEIYKADVQVSRVIGILATLAVIISCLGLFGLSSYSAEKRIKEIGIRKVLGASVGNVVTLLSIDFVKLVLLANLIAWPIAWFALNRWLEDFAYRIDISWWVFASAGLGALLIALATVSFQAFRAAIANPIESLRNE